MEIDEIVTRSLVNDIKKRVPRVEEIVASRVCPEAVHQSLLHVKDILDLVISQFGKR